MKYAITLAITFTILALQGCDKADVEDAKRKAGTVIIAVKDEATKAYDSANFSEITGKVCEAVNASKEEALAVTGVATGLVGGAATATTAAGVTAVAHSSGAVILTGGAGYIAGTLGTAGAATVGVLTAPATVTLAAVSVVAVGSAIYICK